MATLVIILVFAIGVSPVMGMTVMPSNRDVNLLVANDAGARFDDFGTDTYNFFNLVQGPTQGQNALHITTDPVNAGYGQVTSSSAQSGVFYMTDTGGRGWDDDGILMLAVNGTVPDTFRVHIKSSGYRWTPVPTDTFPLYSGITYVTGATDEYFTKADLIYGPQNWRPAPGENNFYPIFEGQDMADTANTFSIMFIDLNAGIIGPNTLSTPSFSGQPVTDNGAVKIEYTLENLHTMAAFDANAYTVSSNQGQGIRWLNRLNSAGASGYSVIGLPVPVAPTAIFSTNVTSGTAPLDVKFTDASTGTAPLSYAWDFTNDGSTDSTDKNPTHTYAVAGSYTAKLTVTNAGGSNSVTHVITVNAAPIAPVAIFSTNVTSGIAPQDVKFTDASTGTAPLSYAWDFTNDGSTDSTDKNPTHTYASAGSYTAKLTVTNAGGSNSVTHVITVNPASASITVISPNGGETWKRGTTQAISWSYTGDPGATVKILLFKAGTQVGTISSGTPTGASGTGSYSWPLGTTGMTGSDFKIQVQSTSQSTVTDTSNNNFNITPASGPSSATITVTSPNGGETWKRGTTQTISWSYTGDPGATVKILLFKAGTQVGTISSGTPTGTSGTGSYSWSLGTTGMTGSDFRITVQSTSQSTVTDTSNNNFNISPASGPSSATITVISPNGGETWKRGTTQTISWSYTGDPGSTVTIVLLKAGTQVGTIKDSTSTGASGTGSYSWSLGTTGMTGNDFRIKVLSVSQPAVSDASNTNFNITL
jgi:PKD repeat protein